MDIIGTLGTKTYPKFGESAIDNSKSGVVNTIGSAFNGLTNNLKGLTPVPGYEGVAHDAWVQMVALEAQFRAAYTGKALS